MSYPYPPSREPQVRLSGARTGIHTEPPWHWGAVEAAFGEVGGWVSGSELAELIRQQSRLDDGSHVSQPVSLVARWIVSGDALSVGAPWGDMLPLFQFDLHRGVIRQDVAMVRAELRDALTGSGLAIWFVTPNACLAGERPALALRSRLQDVRRAARRVASGS